MTEIVSFVKKKHELEGLLKAVTAGSEDAVKLLVQTMNNEDEKKVTLKMRTNIAQALIKLQIDIAAEISRDQIVRTVAEVKARGLGAPPLRHGEKRRLAPVTNFDTIQEVK